MIVNSDLYGYHGIRKMKEDTRINILEKTVPEAR